MWLIHTKELKLYDFVGNKVPRYAILSHTWEGHEISFAEFQQQSSSSTIPDDSKVTQSCRVAASYGLDYVWVDTCCIDKRSSAELSEAINSMYMWYEHAEVCFVYLADISVQASMQDKEAKKLKNSRWFSRGWTLQELLAPYSILFFDRNWVQLGSKVSLQDQLSAAAHISKEYLFTPRYASVAIKMSWAASRFTTRREDIAYCLLGLFNVNMPLLYGEGIKAFWRLQQAIMASSADESIFAWFAEPSRTWYHGGILASNPTEFSHSGNIIQAGLSVIDRSSYHVTNRGLEMTLRARKHKDPGVVMHGDPSGSCTMCEIWEIPLACADKFKEDNPIRLQLHREAGASRWVRCISGAAMRFFDDRHGRLSGFHHEKFFVSIEIDDYRLMGNHSTPGLSLSRLTNAVEDGIRVSFTEPAQEAFSASTYLPYCGNWTRTSASYVFKNESMAFGMMNQPAFILKGIQESRSLRLFRTVSMEHILSGCANDHFEELLMSFDRPLELYSFGIGCDKYFTIRTTSDWHLIYGPIHMIIDITYVDIDQVL